VVEDEEAVRKLTRLVLERLGLQVVEARDGEEALRVLEQRGHALRLVIADTVLPRMSGPALGEVVAARWPGVKMLYASGYSDHPLLRRMTAERDVPFVRKPFQHDTLCRKVRDLLQGDHHETPAIGKGSADVHHARSSREA